MAWQLVREVGIEYTSRPGTTTGQSLCFPTYAARTADGSYVIAEETGVDKLVPFRFGCRTLRVDVDGRIRFDSTSLGIDDGFGCVMDDGQIAIVRRTCWELVIVSPDGKVTECFPLHRFSKRIPRYARWTASNTFLVVFFNRSFDIDIVEMDRHGRLLWFLPMNDVAIGIPASVERVDDHRLLVADSFRHCVCELDRHGQTLWQFGEPENPSRHTSRLSSPNAATCCLSEKRLVADSRNHRVLSIDLDGRSRPITTPPAGFCDPSYATELSPGEYLVCDTGNRRVIHIDQSGQPLWEFGDQGVRRRHLSYPRSVDFSAPNRYLVADTGNDRVVEIVDGELQACPLDGEHRLFWPRCVRRLAEGGCLVADARNGRILETTDLGDVVHQLSSFEWDGTRRPLKDPHDVRMLPNGHLLICDSPHNLVIEVDWSGRAYRVIGDRDDVLLKDPHSAQQLPDGSVLITDTGNHRLLLVNTYGHMTQSIQAIRKADRVYRLHQPRYAEAAVDGIVVVADTAQNRILGCTLTGEFHWEFSSVPNSRLSGLSQPRWATMVNSGELVVCDHFHHRIVHVKRASNS